jgi:hypothetical protein
VRRNRSDIILYFPVVVFYITYFRSVLNVTIVSSCGLLYDIATWLRVVDDDMIGV